jgi:hypothetical protein
MRDSEKSNLFIEDEVPEKKNCGYFMKKLDYEILRPLLIFEYSREKMHTQDDHVEMIINDANIMG